MVLSSAAAAEIKAPADLAMTEYLTSRADYAKDQLVLCEAVRELIAENS